ncbi:uncharacterized protein LOC143848865 [Tasmannia lanceolata]|uniref:uncharacterized protein LOC143848865 n=1 Tax=Tasmannia lanceolata TaxID=3420 RepID=UPI004064433A
MTDFNDCISNCSLRDIRSIGHSWTWNNKSKGEARKQAKLDRAKVNDLWLQEHPKSYANLPPPGISDHCPITIALNPHTPQGPKPFRFLHMWLEDASLYPIVERAWATEIIGNPMYQFTQKLKIVKNHIRAWNENVFGRIDVKTPLVRKELFDVQVMLHFDLTNAELAEREGVLSQKLLNLAAMEESFYRQKSRVQWLKLGDSNTKFFYNSLKTRLNRNHIMALKHATDGDVLTVPREISLTLVSHFEKILNNGNLAGNNIPDPLKILTPEEANTLCKPVSEEEIRDTVWKAN